MFFAGKLSKQCLTCVPGWAALVLRQFKGCLKATYVACESIFAGCWDINSFFNHSCFFPLPQNCAASSEGGSFQKSAYFSWRVRNTWYLYSQQPVSSAHDKKIHLSYFQSSLMDTMHLSVFKPNSSLLFHGGCESDYLSSECLVSQQARSLGFLILSWNFLEFWPQYNKNRSKISVSVNSSEILSQFYLEPSFPSSLLCFSFRQETFRWADETIFPVWFFYSSWQTRLLLSRLSLPCFIHVKLFWEESRVIRIWI